MEKSSHHQTETKKYQMIKGDADHISELPDDVLVRILSLLRYKEAVKTASVSRRWEGVVLTQFSDLEFCMSLRGDRTIGTPSEQRVQNMERTLRRRCAEGNHSVKTLSLFYQKDVPMECRCADEFIALANAQKLLLRIQCKTKYSDEDEEDDAAGAWYLKLPPATTELHVLPFSSAVRPPHICGSGVDTLRSLTLKGWAGTVLCQDFLLTELPSLEDLHIRDCTVAASIHITSDTMPRLRHLEIIDVAVMTKDTKAEIHVMVDELRTLRVSGYKCSSTTKPTKSELERYNFRSFVVTSRFIASFTTYSSFRLRAPRLRVFDWRCCYADEVCIESVGHLSDVVVQVAAGLKPKQYGEHTYVTVDQRDKLMRDILRGLMRGLQPLNWEDIKRKCVQRDERWMCFEIANAYTVTQ